MTKKSKEVQEIVGPDNVPLKKLPANWDFLRSIQVWQGAPKTGKTSTAAALGEVAEELGITGISPFFLLFEPGSSGVDVNCTSKVCPCGGKKNCPDCEGVGMVREILRPDNDPADPFKSMNKWFDWAAESPFNPLVIDTGDAMYNAISDGVCTRLGVPAPHYSDHGIAWGDINSEWREKLGVLVSSNKSIIVLTHLYYQEKRLRNGATIQSATFGISGKSKPFLAGLANQIINFEVQPDKDGDEDKHIVTTRRCSGMEVGDHWNIYPEELDLGKSPQEGAKNILSCFYDIESK